MKQPAYIIFQAYGPEYILQECMYALLTFSRVHTATLPDDLGIWIYTDQEDWFRSHFPDCPLPLSFRKMDEAMIRQWRGEINFVHRLKIEVLRDFCQQRSGNIIYLDTDTFFTAPVNGIFEHIHNGALYMHVQESILREEANPMLRKLNRFLQKNNPLSVNGKQLNISADTAMWNAGMLGFHTDRAPLLDQILQFTDEVYRVFPKHVVEQFAFSLYFQQAAQIKSSAAHIFHYWNFKEMRPYLKSFFTHFSGVSWADLVRYSNLIQPQIQLQEMIGFYRARNGWEKMRRKSWQPVMPDWDLLLQQMQ